MRVPKKSSIIRSAFVVCAVFVCAITALTTSAGAETRSPTPDVINGEPVAGDSEELHAVAALLTNYDPANPASKYFNQYCGGTLIKPRLVLTAAACVTEYSEEYPKYVSIGATDLNATGGSVVAVSARRVWHDTDIGGLPHDLALVELAEPVNSVQPAVLESDSNAPLTGTPGLVAGWGEDENLSLPSELMQAAVTVLSSSECEDLYGTGVNEAGYFCAGHMDVDSPRDVCLGDAGGPLVVGTSAEARVAGINVFDETCAEDDAFGLYQRVSTFRAWIDWASLVELNFSNLKPEFEPIVFGSSKVSAALIRITNNGGARATILSQKLTGADFSTNGACEAGLRIEAWEHCDLYVFYRPTSAGQHAGSIELVTNNSAEAVQTIPLDGFALSAGTPSLKFSRKPFVFKTRKGPKMAFDLSVQHSQELMAADPNTCSGSATATVTFRGIRKKIRTKTTLVRQSNPTGVSQPPICVASFGMNVPATARNRKSTISFSLEPNAFHRATSISKTFKPRWFKAKR